MIQTHDELTREITQSIFKRMYPRAGEEKKRSQGKVSRKQNSSSRQR